MNFFTGKRRFAVSTVFGILSVVLLLSSVRVQGYNSQQADRNGTEKSKPIGNNKHAEGGVSSNPQVNAPQAGKYERSQEDLDEGLFARYPFEGSANDASGNGNDGTVNGATLTTGHEGNPESAYKFDGSNYIEVPPWNRGKSSSRSWTGWVLAQDGGGYFQRSNYGADNGGEWQLEWLDDSNRIHVRTVIQPGNHKLSFNTNGTYEKGTWHFVAAVWDLENDKVEVYVNGERDGSIEIPDGHIGLGDGGQSTDWKLGGTWNGGDFHGKIDDVRIYSRALSESEVQQLYGDANQVIAFTSTRDGNEEIYRMDGDGSNQVRLTNNSAEDRSPAISPDGQDIVFFSKRTGSWELFKISVDGTGLTQLTSDLPASQGARGIDWNPDGTELAFDIKNNDVFKIYRADPDGSNVSQLVDEDASGDTRDYTGPQYSPNGDQITMRGNEPFNGFSSEVWIANADGSDVTKLTSSPGDARAERPTFGVEDGTLKIVHSRTPDSDDRQIWTMNTDGSDAVNISDNNSSDTWPTAPEGPGAGAVDQILFSSDRSGERALWRMGIDGSNPQMVASVDFQRRVDWWVGESGLVAIETKAVDSDGEIDFGDTGVDINFTGTSGSGGVTVKHFGNGPSGTEGIDEENVSSYRHVIEVDGDLSFGSDTEVQFDASSLGGITDPGDVTIYERSDPGQGSFSALQTTYDSSTDELVAETGSFSEFALASDSNPLPIELSSFSAAAEGEKIRLTWHTASETSNARFEVQRKADQQDSWSRVGSVEGAGTTTESQRYRFTDADLPYEADRLTYRLKQVDIDGSTSLSETVTVERGVSEVELLGTHPNPVRSQATVRYALPETRDVTIRLYDVLGRQVQTVVNAKQKGRHEQQLDASGLPSGTYFLRLRAGRQTRTKRLTVVR